MTEFKVGDEVKIKGTSSDFECTYCEHKLCEKIKKGKVISIEPENGDLQIGVEFEEDFVCYFSVKEVELITE